MVEGAVRRPGQAILTHEMDHPFKLKKGTKHVCDTCGANRLHPDHGCFSWQAQSRLIDNRHVRKSTNDLWQEMYVDRLGGLEIPRPCSFIEVAGRISFPSHAKGSRDEINYMYPIAKFLGDALQRGGWLVDDDWASFRFRELDLAGVTPGVQRLELMISYLA